MNQTNENKRVLFPSVKDGETFMVGEMEFIKFHATAAGTPVVAKNILFRSAFGENNNLTESKVLKKLKEHILPEIINAVGADNVLTFKTDLTTWDGLKAYEDLESKISLPTMDFYRENVKIFDLHKVRSWWWLATPDSAQPHDDPDWTLCVSPSGRLGDSDYDGGVGVRPFCILKSNIFVSK